MSANSTPVTHPMQLRVLELREELKKRNLSVSGSKQELIDRLCKAMGFPTLDEHSYDNSHSDTSESKPKRRKLTLFTDNDLFELVADTLREICVDGKPSERANVIEKFRNRMGVTHDGFVLVLKLILDDSHSVLSAKKRCVQQLIAWRTYPAEFAFVDLCMLGELELVQLLAGSAKEMPRCPIDFNYREVDRGGGHTGFTIACCRGYLNLVQYLSQLVDVNYPDINGDTGLHWAVMKNRVDVIKYLVANPYCNLSANNIVPGDMRTPLHMACQIGNPTVVKLLLSGGALVNSPRADRDTPLHSAVADEHADVVSILLRAGADPNIKNDILGTPIFEACLKGNLPIVKALVSAGAWLNVIDAYGEKPLTYAQTRGRKDVVAFLKAEMKIEVSDRELTVYVKTLLGRVIPVAVLPETTVLEIKKKATEGRHFVPMTAVSRVAFQETQRLQIEPWEAMYLVQHNRKIDDESRTVRQLGLRDGAVLLFMVSARKLRGEHLAKLELKLGKQEPKPEQPLQNAVVPLRLNFGDTLTS